MSGMGYIFREWRLVMISELLSFVCQVVREGGKVEEEGVDLVKMNALLLRKIEELTLYVLYLHHRIEELEGAKEE